MYAECVFQDAINRSLTQLPYRLDHERRPCKGHLKRRPRGPVQGISDMGFLSAFQQQAPHLHHQAPEKFSNILLKYLESLDAIEEGFDDERILTLVARTPSSAVVKAVVGHARYLASRRVKARVLLACFTPAPLMKGLLAALTELGGEGDAHERVRWLRRPRLLDAHEQLAMGSTFCWTGDSLRRSEDRRNTLDIFSFDAPETTRLGAQAFQALWKASAAAPLTVINEEEAQAVNEEPVTAASAAAPNRAGKDMRTVLLTEIKVSTRH
jgi:hypothetical protein